MTDETTNEEEPDKGPLPAGPSGTDPAPHVRPIQGDEMQTQDGVSSEPRSETISQTDSASATS